MAFFSRGLEDILNEPLRFWALQWRYLVEIYRTDQKPTKLGNDFPHVNLDRDGEGGGFKKLAQQFEADLQPKTALEKETKKIILTTLDYLVENPRPCVAFDNIFVSFSGTFILHIRNPHPSRVLSIFPLRERPFSSLDADAGPDADVLAGGDPLNQWKEREEELRRKKRTDESEEYWKEHGIVKKDEEEERAFFGEDEDAAEEKRFEEEKKTSKRKNIVIHIRRDSPLSPSRKYIFIAGALLFLYFWKAVPHNMNS